MNLRACLILLVLPVIAADQEEKPLPHEILRGLAEQDGRGFGGFRGLAADPETLLDVIFVPQGTEAPDPGMVKAARERIPRLGDESYAEREKASAWLRDLGTPVSGVLKEALADPDPEVRFRCAKLLGVLSGRKQLADLDYGNVQFAIERIVREMEDPALLVAVVEGALQRIGRPTVHGQEALLMKPVFAELAKRHHEASVPAVTAALTGESRELAENAAAALGEATSEASLNPAYLAALSVHRPEVLGPLLARAPRLREGVAEERLARYRQALDEIAAHPGLPPEVVVKARRLILVGFFDAASLRALIGAAYGDGAEVVGLALRDPRLAGIPLEGAELAAGLIDHPDSAVREAAGVFLLTRPEEDFQRRGLDFLPHLGKDGIDSLKLLFGGTRDPEYLREQLKKRVDAKGRNWKSAERLLFALPDAQLPLPRLDIPFGFR